LGTGHIGTIFLVFLITLSIIPASLFSYAQTAEEQIQEQKEKIEKFQQEFLQDLAEREKMRELLDERSWNEVFPEIEKKVQEELAKGTIKDHAKLLVFSNMKTWGGIISDTDDVSYSLDEGGNSIIPFKCEPDPNFVPTKWYDVTLGGITSDNRGFIHFFIIQDGEILKDGKAIGSEPLVAAKDLCKGSFQIGGAANMPPLEKTQTSSSELVCGLGTVLKDGECVVEEKNEVVSEAGGGCLIATATYGSELAPQVQQLRELRDNTLLQTSSGTSFMTGFNEFYYSFSPIIADWERENPVFKESVKLTITPLLASLSILNYVNIDSEEEMLGYGISLILLNVGMYIVAPVGIGLFVVSRKN